MSVQYSAISWNRQKKIYDWLLVGGIALYLGLFIGIGALLYRTATAETLIIRALGTAAFLLLHVVLCIGPLCRLDSRFLPLLYNRRHMGVATFIVGCGHGVFALVQFHSQGTLNPLVSVLVSNTNYVSLANFPFQPFGLLALMILFLMAATSHDYWLRTLTPPTWKRLHMMVYLAYTLLIVHVSFGTLQSERSLVYVALVAAGLCAVTTVHLLAAAKERREDSEAGRRSKEFVDVCAVQEIPEKRAVTRCIAGERVAVFKYDGKVSAVSNICRHQNGPLGEGRIIDGCITCPWHGYQYLPETGASPPPFTEKIAIFETRIVNGRVLVCSRPKPPGTFVEPAQIEAAVEVAR